MTLARVLFQEPRALLSVRRARNSGSEQVSRLFFTLIRTRTRTLGLHSEKLFR